MNPTKAQNTEGVSGASDDFSSRNEENRSNENRSENRGSDKLRNIKDGIRDSLEGARPAVEETLQNARTRLNDVASTVSQRGREISQNLDDQVHRSPWSFIGGVALGALLLGYIMGRRS